MQVLQSSGDIHRQTDPDAPRQVQITVQQLLQVTSVYILEREQRGDRTWIIYYFLQDTNVVLTTILQSRVTLQWFHFN